MQNLELENNIFPGHKHFLQLNINGKVFTKREIDVIACIINGRVVKKIATLLSISDKTVESHIRNITLKLGRSTQESIIDFIEKSDKYLFLKQYYLNLLIQAAFDAELKSIHECTVSKKVLLFVDEPAQKNYAWLVRKIANDLQIAGIIILLNHDNRTHEFYDYVVYFLGHGADNLAQSAFVLAPEKPVSFLCTSQKVALESKNKIADFSCSILSEYENYYYLIFNILLKIYPDSNIDKNFAKFKIQYLTRTKNAEISHIRNEDSTVAGYEETVVDLKEKSYLNKMKIILKQRYKQLLVGFIILVLLGFYSHQGQVQEVKLANKLSFTNTSSVNILEQLKYQKNVVWNLPRQDHKFIGRKQILNDLHDKLHAKNNTQTISPVSVCAGLGGIGKTQLALQYAYHSKHNYTLKAWFLSENSDQLKQQYIEFALNLGYRDSEPSFDKAKSYIHAWLTKNPGWLLIYDNVESYEQLKDFLPQEGGWVIITTRQQNWPNSFRKMDMDVMPEHEAIELINSLIVDNNFENKLSELNQLVRTLGYLPLALAQAGSYIRHNSVSLEQYLKLYKDHEAALIQDENLPEGASSLPIATTWNISLKAIVRDSNLNNQQSLAVELLSACAYLAPEKISQELMLSWLKELHPELPNPEWVLPKLIGQLRQYSMLSIDTDGGVVIHRLVQAVLRYKNQAAASAKDSAAYLSPQWFEGLLNAVHKQFINKTEILKDEKMHRDLLPHLQILIKYYKEIWPNATELKLVPIWNDIGIIFSKTHDFKTARIFHERALALLTKNYSPGHLQIGLTQDYLGNTYRNLGLERESKKMHEQALQIIQKHYGKESIEVSDVLDHLGRSYRMLGDAKESEKLHEKSLMIKEKHYGENHIQVALVLDQLGRDYRNLLKLELAKSVIERSLRIKEKYYGDNHVEVAYSLDLLGRCYRYLGDIKKARDLHASSVKIKENYYGPDSVQVAYTLDQLGRDLRYLGELQRAKELHIRSVKIKQAHYGEDHVDLSYSIDYLGRVYRMLGAYDKAKELHLKNLQIKENYYGCDDIARAYASDQLARDYRESGDVTKAQDLHEYALNAMKQYPSDNVTIALMSDQLGKDYRLLGKFLQAKELHEFALKVKIEYFGANHPETANTYSNLGAVLVSMGRVQEGLVYLDKALNFKESYYGENNIQVVETLLEIATAKQLAGNLEQAKAYLKHAFKIRTRVLGADHAMTIAIHDIMVKLNNN